jgi:meso-butanediol dehydrogenase/(S,S)-butanediol dehydrogenase/diacetyl reductase
MRKTVVVTGGGSGIGRAICRELASLDWRVIVSDIRLEAAEETRQLLEGGEHEAHGLDVTDIEKANALATLISSRWGLEGWVNNAGVSRMRRFTEISEAEYDTTLAINLKGVFVCGQAAARAMIAQGRGGKIVNTASMAGKQGGVPFLADYVASKFGVIGLTQAMAFELASRSITVNSVCPGFVATPMQDRELAWESELKGSIVEAVRDSWIADTPLGRLQQPEDVANVVGFLLSDKSDFLTGESISANGGAYMD